MSLKKNTLGKVILLISIICVVMGSSVLVFQFLFASWADEMIVKEIPKKKELLEELHSTKSFEDYELRESKIEIRKKKSWGPFIGSRWRAFGVITTFIGMCGILLSIKLIRREEKG